MLKKGRGFVTLKKLDYFLTDSMISSLHSEQTRYLFQRLSLLLMRGNAALILNRTPVHADADADAVVDGDQDFDT